MKDEQRLIRGFLSTYYQFVAITNIHSLFDFIQMRGTTLSKGYNLELQLYCSWSRLTFECLILKRIDMAAEIITKEDLQEFGERLLDQMKALISGGSTEEQGKFLKSYQVKNLLKISSNTLQGSGNFIRAFQLCPQCGHN